MRPIRLVPEESFPSYAFVPGQKPHPVSDPAGHSFGVEPPPSSLDPQRWYECRAYLMGFDLFNHGFYWESHVHWEAVWLGCGRKGTAADLLKGLIKLAAAGVKHREGKPAGVASHCGRAMELWRGVHDAVTYEHYLGLYFTDLIRIATDILQHGWPRQPPLLMPVMPK